MTQSTLVDFGFRVDTAMIDQVLNEVREDLIKIYAQIGKDNTAIDYTEKKTDQVKKKVEDVQMSARNTWSYVNQLSTLFLNNLEKIAGGSEKTAWIQRTLATASIVQQEFAIKRLILEAAAAYSAGNIPTGAMLSAIAAMMQISAASAYTTRLQSINTESQASRIRQQIETYRS